MKPDYDTGFIAKINVVAGLFKLVRAGRGAAADDAKRGQRQKNSEKRLGFGFHGFNFNGLMVSIHHNHILRTRACIAAHGKFPKPFGDQRPDKTESQQQQPRRRQRRKLCPASTRTGTLLTSSTGSAKVNTALKAPRKRLVRHPRDVEQIIVAVNNSLRAHRPEADGRQHEHQRVMDQNPPPPPRTAR